MGGLQSGVTPNFTELYNEQSQHIAYIIEQTRTQPEQVFEASPAAVAGWVQAVKDSAYANSGFSDSCTPGYYNNEGKPGPESRQNGFFMGEPGEFMKILEECRAKGGMTGLSVRRAPGPG